MFKWTNDVFLYGKKITGILVEKVENNFLSNLEKVNFQELTCPTHVPLKIEDEIK